MSPRESQRHRGDSLDDRLSALKSSLLVEDDSRTQDLSHSPTEQSGVEQEQSAVPTPCLVKGEQEEEEKEGQEKRTGVEEGKDILEGTSGKVDDAEKSGFGVAADGEEEKEVEEEVVFHSLVLLKCHLQLGNANVMEPLSQKASDSLKEAVKMIQASLSESLPPSLPSLHHNLISPSLHR